MDQTRTPQDELVAFAKTRTSVGAKEVAEQFGINTLTASHRLMRAVDRGQLVRVKRGVYQARKRPYVRRNGPPAPTAPRTAPRATNGTTGPQVEVLHELHDGRLLVGTGDSLFVASRLDV